MRIYGRSANGRFLPRWHFDPFDPRGWGEPDRERPYLIFLDCKETFCEVDYVDWLWAKKYTWRATESKTKGKFYATRDTSVNGQRVKIFLHKAILNMMIAAPSELHSIGDHMDGNSLNNRRSNLRWATPSQNGRNRYGIILRQPDLFESFER